MRIRFCPECGANTNLLVPAGDNRERAVCQACGVVHYVNPKVVCGCLLTCGDDVLLAKRSIEPRSGFWTIPAGFMEEGETTEKAAARECVEEALATPVSPTLYGLIALPRISQLYVIYRGQVEAGAYGAGEESAAVALYAEKDIPWNELAFPVVEYTLRRFFSERRHGRYGVFDITINARPGEPLSESTFGDLVSG